MEVNMNEPVKRDEKIAEILRIIGQPQRIQMLALLSQGESCVCHMEAHLGIRQSVISQNLMALREAGIVAHRREGKNIYYHVADDQIIRLICQAAQICGVEWEEIVRNVSQARTPCPCPHCNPDKPGTCCS
jgi:ArsR family transcriptional regulator